jgi:hypothetical protein
VHNLGLGHRRVTLADHLEKIRGRVVTKVMGEKKRKKSIVWKSKLCVFLQHQYSDEAGNQAPRWGESTIQEVTGYSQACIAQVTIAK